MLQKSCELSDKLLDKYGNITLYLYKVNDLTRIKSEDIPKLYFKKIIKMSKEEITN